jgi:uncharacterized protein YbjT (DUF2867 family)
LILIAGATGNTGREIIKRLADSGAGARGMVRKRPDQGPDAWPGVEFITANFDDPASIRHALEGVDRAFLVTNSSECVEERQLEFVDIARAAGLRHIVYLSQLHADVKSPVRFLRYHAVVEEAISSSGIAFTHLRPNLFMQGLLEFHSAIASKGRFFAPAGDAAVSIVDVRDIAAVAVAALTENGHEGKTYDITGPEALTHAQMVCQFTTVLGKPVTFVDMPEAAMRDALLGFGFPEWQADGLIEDYAHYRRGEASEISNCIQEVTGLSPGCFAAFARDYKQAFSC